MFVKKDKIYLVKLLTFHAYIYNIGIKENNTLIHSQYTQRENIIVKVNKYVL